jgi:hypothetical protein
MHGLFESFGCTNQEIAELSLAFLLVSLTGVYSG